MASTIDPWRGVLADIIKNSRAKQQLATALHVAPITLQRWVEGESVPRLENFRGLVRNVEASQRATLIAALPESVIQGLGLPTEEKLQSQEIPSDVYASVLRTRYSISDPMNFRTLCDQVLQNALRQLDPQRYGLEISIATYMPPSADGKVLSLREHMGRGTPPWHRQLEDRVLFLGIDSLAGYAVTSGRSFTVKRESQAAELFPAQWIAGEESAMACPLMYKNLTSGCLLVSSIQPEFFELPGNGQIVQNYGELLSTAFHPMEFYATSALALRRMPSYEEQGPLIATFRKRVNELMRFHGNNEHPLTIQQAENQIWKEIERELISYSTTH